MGKTTVVPSVLHHTNGPALGKRGLFFLPRMGLGDAHESGMMAILDFHPAVSSGV